MSALGHFRTLRHVRMMSVHHSKADICWRVRHVCEVPEADSRIAAKRPLAGLSFGCVRPHKLAAALEAPGRPEKACGLGDCGATPASEAVSARNPSLCSSPRLDASQRIGKASKTLKARLLRRTAVRVGCRAWRSFAP
jgi:hypothetical protein